MSAFLVLLCFLFQSYGAEKKSLPIKVLSQNTELNKTINSRFRKNKLNNAELQARVRRYLHNQSYFSSSVSVSDEENNRLIRISNPFQWEVFFENNSNLTSYELRKIFKDKDFEGKPQRFLDEAKLLLSSEYRKQGYHFIEITSESKVLKAPFKRRAIFYIEEGKRVRLDKVTFSKTSKKFSKKKLRRLLNEYSGPPISKGFYSLSVLRSGVQSLKNDLNNQGYFRSKFEINQVKFNKEEDKAVVNISSEINEPTLISGIKFNGNNAASDFWLNLLIGLKIGEPINLYKLEEGLETIKTYYAQRGFLEAQVEEDDILSYSRDLKKVSINISINEGEQVLVDKISISGLEKTRKYVIQKELEFKDGDVLTQEKLQSSYRNLRNLGIFTKVDIDTKRKSENTKGREIKIKLAEKKPGIFTTGAGISNERDLTYKVYAGLGYRNLGGKARTVSSRFEIRLNNEVPEEPEFRGYFSFLEPYFLNSKTKARVNLSATDEIWDVSRGSNPEVTIVKSLNLSTQLERQISDHFRLTWSVLDISRREESELTGRFDKINELIVSTGPKIELDYRNNPLVPSKGSFTKFSLEYAGFFSKLDLADSITPNDDLEFVRFNALHTFYKEISPKLIFAQSFQGGFLQNLSSNDFFPKSRAFFLGGALSIRGFDPSRDEERIPNDRQLLVENGRIQGGGALGIADTSYYYLMKSELRFPLFERSNIWGAVFYDGGAVLIPELEGNENTLGIEALDKWRHTAGIGLRWNTPIGPFNFELGYKLDRNLSFGEKAFRFHISVGTF